MKYILIFILIVPIFYKLEQKIYINNFNQLNIASMLQPIPQQAILKDSLYYIWGASPIKGDDNKYHLFYSRWKKELGFMAWVTHSEIAHAVSDSLLGPYTFSDIALPVRGNSFWDGTTTHNPTIHKFDNNYYLYYTGNCGDGINIKNSLNWSHRNSQRIGVAVSSSPYGPWKRFDRPLVDVSPDSTAFDALATNNPSIAEMPDGKYLMVYKAVAKKNPLPFGGPVVHMTAISDSPIGPFLKNSKPIFTKEESDFPAEDPFIWYQNGRYYAIVKDMKGDFTGKGRSLALFTSENSTDWELAKHFFVSDLCLHWESGETDTVAYLERPQLFLDKGIPKALFLAVSPSENYDNTYNVHIPLK